jgi:site-specific recombinase XerD
MSIEQSSIRIEEALSVFMLDAKSRRFTPKTIAHYSDRLGRFTKWLLTRPLTLIHQVTSTHIKEYLVTLQERELSSATQHTEARAIRAFFNFCVREELISVSPFAKVKMPRLEQKSLSALEPEDVKKLVGSCQTARDRAALLLLLDTGLRAQEFLKLNLGDVDITQGTIVVRQGKGQKDRTVYIGAKCKLALARHIRQRNSSTPTLPLWASERDGQRLTYTGLRLLLQRIGKRAGVADCKPHTLRRSFALWSLRAGMSIYHLQKLMGHADLTVLKRYLALVESDAKAAHEQYGAVDAFL